MSLLACIRKAGTALHADDKSAILAAAKRLRKGGMELDDAGRAAVRERIAALEEPVVVTAEPKTPTSPPDVAAEAPAEFNQPIDGLPPFADIPYNTAQAAHQWTSHVPEERGKQEQAGFRTALADAWDQAIKVAGEDQAAVERVTETFKDLVDGYRARYISYLTSRSRVASSMITGPARFPVERNRKRSDAADRKAQEANDYLQRGIKRLMRAARGPIDNSPEAELERVRLNLSEREEDQERMKAANAALRKGDIEALAELGFSEEQVADLKKPDFAGRKGFPDYKLTNNNAEIRRLRERLTDAEARMAAAQDGPKETARAGVRVVEDAQEDRLRLFFDGKPEEAVRDDLKSNGFKWSPKAGAWQRQLTDNARRAAQAVLNKHFPADDAKLSRSISPEKRRANFNSWSGGAPVIDSETANTRGFKTGERIVVEAYHGTARPDRVGTKFQRKRATSGPMAFFTSDPKLASSYALGKEDTSLSQDYEGDYAEWFTLKAKGARAPRSIDQAWWSLTPEQRERIRALSPRVTSSENENGDNDIVLGDSSVTNGVGSYDYEMQKTARAFSGGNPLRALVESWLASGWMFGEEQDFLKVLKLAGMPMDAVEYNSPQAKYPFVYKAFVRMGNPLVTSDVPASTIEALREAAKSDRSRAVPIGADAWDKNTITLREWVQKLEDPERSTYAWTAIPDKVTEVLRSLGYDGIVDWSGKSGGDIVAPVYVPFSESQVKSAIGNKGTFDPTKGDILLDRGGPFVAVEPDPDTGHPTFANAQAGITLAFPQTTERLEVIESEGEQVVNYAILPSEGFEPLGYVELLLKDGKPVSLLDIEVNDKGAGTGRKVIETLLASNPGADLNISNIVPAAQDFWARMGVPVQNVEQGAAYDGTLNWETYSEAQDDRGAQGNARPSGRASQRSNAGSEGARREPAQEGPRTQGLSGNEAAAVKALPEADRNRLARTITVERARELAATMAPGIDVRVVESVDEMPPSERDRVYAQAPGGQIRGVYFHKSDRIWLVTDQLHSEAEAAFVMLHEAFHRGLAKTIGPDAKRLLKSMYLTNGTLRRATEAQMKAHKIGLDEAIEEALADLAGKGEARDLRGWSKLVGMIRAWLSAAGEALGLKIEWTDDMIADFVAGIRQQGLGGVVVNPSQDVAAASRRADQTSTPEFAKWFGDSRVVGAEGKPLIVYHGTGADISAFDGSKTAMIDGVFMTPDKTYANQVARGRWDKGEGEAPNVMPLYVSLQTPRVIPAERYNLDNLSAAMSDHTADGVIVLNEDGSIHVVIARYSTQIKSATGNRGTFDPESADIRMSRSAQDMIDTHDGVFDFNRLGATRQDRIRTVVDGSRPFWLGALTRDQIADIYGKDIPPVKVYDTLTRQMENQRSKIAQDADDLYSQWAKLGAAINDRLSRLMLDATVNSVHPDGTFTSIPGNDAETEAKRKAEHQRLTAEFKALPSEAQAMYRKVRDFHSGMLEQLKTGLERRIERQVQEGKARAAALTSIRQAFDRYKEHGPYFPLSRFGDFLVIGTRADGERVVASYRTSGEQATAARALRNDGFTVKTKTAKDYSRALDGSAGKFAGDVLTMLNDLDMSEAEIGGKAADLKSKLMDDVNQLFIRALPDLSYRKHFAHRKNTPGFSSDMMRGFASSAFHAASHIARLNHADQMTFALEDAFKVIEQSDEGDFNQQTQVLNELAKRHDASMNPNTSPIASILNQIGFVMYLGASPAAGLVNLLQTPMVTLPYLGARHGFGKAGAAMAKATSDIMGAKANRASGWNAADSPKLTASERETMRKLQDEGVIDLTQAHDLAAATAIDTGNVARSKAAFAMSRAMKIVGWTFHVPEVMNRQVTALSAYRLEMEKFGKQDVAEEAAREAIKRTHFDYSSSNRARYMQGNVARVLLQFKQYAQNMTYLLSRAAHQAMKGESPEVRAIARRQLVATLGATFVMAGALGLPGLGAAAGLIGMLAGALDDDDKPWEWKVEFRNLMADTFGKQVGEVISHGLPRALMPWDVASRVGMGDLWFRSNDREGQSPREAFATDIANILGPTAGTALGWYTASDHMARGNWSKAAESIVPKFIRDPIQAARMTTEGVTSYKGEHLKDLTAAESLGKLLGFAPASVSEMYEGRNAVKNAETAVMEKRTLLLGKAVRARMERDAEAAAEAMEQIRAFNQRNPREAIKSENIASSLLARRRHERQTIDGTYLPKNRDHLREVGRFATTE